MLALSTAFIAGFLTVAQQVVALPTTANVDNLATRATPSSSRASGPYGLDNVQCSTVTLQAKANSMNIQFVGVDDNYSNATYVTETVLAYSTAMSNWTSEHIPSMTLTPFNATYTIKGHYCTPISHAKKNSSLIVGVHGVGFDSRYWNVGYKKSYSFVRHAASYGYSSFIYDRIGCGASEAPATGGFSALQAPTEVSVLKNILGQLRNSTVVGNKKHSKITLMGHSYGSAQSQAISATVPDLIDGLVLTGFSTNSSSTASFFLAGTYTIANEVSTLPQLKSRPSVWLGTASSIADVESFFDPPHYEQGALTYARSITQPVTLGSLTTIGAIGGVASNYTGPVFVIDGAQDLPFCGRNCYAPAPTGGDLASAVQMLFPATSNFTSSIINNTGHGIALAPSSGAASQQIMSFIIANSL